jgi:uncharacterized membrane protein
MDSIGMILDAILVFVGVRTIYQSEIVLSQDRKITGWAARGIGLLILLAVAMNYIPVPGLKIVSMVLLLGIFIAALVYLYWKKKKQE